MKNFIRIMALVMVAAMLCCVMVSCAKTLKGTYEGMLTTYTFDGKNVTISVGVGALSASVTGTYTIEDDQITISVDENSEYAGTFDFEEGDGWIKISGITYTKK